MLNNYCYYVEQLLLLCGTIIVIMLNNYYCYYVEQLLLLC